MAEIAKDLTQSYKDRLLRYEGSMFNYPWFDSILPVGRLFNHHMIPISWQKIFVTDPTSSKTIECALAQELKSKTGVSGVRWRLPLLSMMGTAAQIEVKCLSFFVLSVLGAALCKFCQCPRSIAPLLQGHSQSTCWNWIDLRRCFHGIMLQSLKQYGLLLSRWWWESLFWGSFQQHLQLDLVRVPNFLLTFYDPSGHWSCMTTPAHVWSVSTNNIKLCTKYVSWLCTKCWAICLFLHLHNFHYLQVSYLCTVWSVLQQKLPGWVIRMVRFLVRLINTSNT